jgi:hypothetical protein
MVGVFIGDGFRGPWGPGLMVLSSQWKSEFRRGLLAFPMGV